MPSRGPCNPVITLRISTGGVCRCGQPRVGERLPGRRDIFKTNLPQESFTYWKEAVTNLGFKFSKKMPLVRDYV
jgi:hypothetical protein